MKILRRGNDPQNDVYRGTCSYCKTEFECLRHEGKYEEDFREGGGFLRVDCPVCTKSAIAYKYNGGQLIPDHKRRDYTWDNMRHQMEADVIPR